MLFHVDNHIFVNIRGKNILPVIDFQTRQHICSWIPVNVKHQIQIAQKHL